MNINFDLSADIISLLISSLVWVLIIVLIYREYRKKTEKLKVWKVIIIMFVGMCTFTFNWSIFGTTVKVPLLPLGVWILFGYFNKKKDQWASYRSFGWIGFFSNFIFLIAALVSPLFHNFIYPKDILSTYISKIEIATLIKLHPSGILQTVKVDLLKRQIESMKKEKIFSEKWYYDTYQVEPPHKERFPYLLVGAEPKWGSGIQTLIYIEQDGKGILIDSPQKQIYFRSKEAFLEGVNEND